MTTGVAHLLASGKSWRQKRIIPKVPTLSSTPTSSVAVAGLDSVAASGSQVWKGTIGALTAKARKKPTKSSRSVVGSIDRPVSRSMRNPSVPPGPCR